MSDDKTASTKQITGANWDLANEDAANWARRHSADLVRGILDTTRDSVRREVSNFTQNKETITQLSQRLANAHGFSDERARMIAVTEVTRSYSEGNQASWRESGVTEGKEWLTNVDERVCPICGPLHGVVVPLNEQFEGGFDGPPAHPRCRCDIAPVVFGDDERDLAGVEFVETGQPFAEIAQGGGANTIAAEIDFIEASGFDPFSDIRPPEGRAPRGMGQEYATRRRIVKRIQTQMNWRSAADEQLRQYRGQTSTRLRWRIDVAKERSLQLNKGIDAMLAIADEVGPDWDFKAELIDGIIEYLSALR